MNRKKVENHFLEKKEHTKIKHRIFENTLRSSISIANMQLLRGTEPKNKKFIYVDLFAGAGEFDSGEKGSILLAIDVIQDHIIISKDSKVPNIFEKFSIIAIEKDDEAFAKLDSSIKNLKEMNPISNIEINLLKGNWEIYQKDLERELKNFDWGFIFVDPFSTELDILKLKELLKSKYYTKMKDILIFFNLQALRREKGKMIDSSKQRLEKTVGLSWEEIEKNQDLSDTVRNGIAKNFSGIKDFAVGVSYPVEVKDKLYTIDYFYLILLTNSAALVNKFLEGYEKIVKEYYNFSFKGLFDEDYYLPNSDMNLLKSWEEKIERFLSWKILRERGYTEVPTIENLVKRLNNYRKLGKLDFECDNKYKYKKNVKGNNAEIGDLKHNEIKSKEDLKSIIIRLK